MATKRIKDLTTTATAEDLLASRYGVLDTPDITKKLPGNLLGGSGSGGEDDPEEYSYFVVINGTKYPCTRIYCPNAASYDANGWTSKWSLWMTENLREPLGTLGSNEWYVNNSSVVANDRKYGHLYTWDVAHGFENDLVSMGLRASEDLRTGWHLPLTNEINALRVVDPIANIYFKQGIIQATNETGLTLDLTGRYTAASSSFTGWQDYGYWWCTQSVDANNAQMAYGINYNNSSFNTTSAPKANGLAIRLTIHLKDDGSIPDEFANYIMVERKPSAKSSPSICGFSYIKTGSGRFEKQGGSVEPFSGIVNVDDFGAAGDGVTDDTACFVMAMKYNLGVTGTRGKNYFVKNLTVGAGTRRTRIKNCSFVSPNNKTDDCLIVTAYSEIEGCTISNYSKAIKAVQSTRPVINARIINNRIQSCLNGIWMYTDPSWTSSNSVDVFDIVIEKNYITEIGSQLGSQSWPQDVGHGRGIKAHGHMDGVKILSNVIEYCWCAIEIGNDCSYFWAPGWSIENNFFEGHSIAPIYMSSFSYQNAYANVDRRCQLSVCGNYFSDYDGGTKNKVYGSYDFWINDWVASIYPCFGDNKDIIGFLKCGDAVMNNGIHRKESYLFMCGPSVSTETSSQMKATDITLFAGMKKYGSSDVYTHHLVVTIDADLESDISLSNSDNNVTITNGLQTITLKYSSPLFTASRLLVNSEIIRILDIKVI